MLKEPVGGIIPKGMETAVAARSAQYIDVEGALDNSTLARLSGSDNKWFSFTVKNSDKLVIIPTNNIAYIMEIQV